MSATSSTPVVGVHPLMCGCGPSSEAAREGGNLDASNELFAADATANRFKTSLTVLPLAPPA